MAALRRLPSGRRHRASRSSAAASPAQCRLTLRDAGIASTVYGASGSAACIRYHVLAEWPDQRALRRVSTHQAQDDSELAQRFNIPEVDLLAAEPVDSTETDFFFGGYYTAAQENADFNLSGPRSEGSQLGSVPDPHSMSPCRPGPRQPEPLLRIETWCQRHTEIGQSLSRLQHRVRQRDDRAELAGRSICSASSRSRQLRPRGLDERYHLQGGNERLPRRRRGAGARCRAAQRRSRSHRQNGDAIGPLEQRAGEFTRIVDGG
jgi:hypothetical protein